VRDGPLGPERIGDVLAGQTAVWVGPTFGLGFYRAGGLQVAFVFDAEQAGINDGVALPRLSGRLMEARCIFGRDRCWLMTACEENGRAVNRFALVMRDGTVAAVGVAAAVDRASLERRRSGFAA